MIMEDMRESNAIQTLSSKDSKKQLLRNTEGENIMGIDLGVADKNLEHFPTQHQNIGT